MVKSTRRTIVRETAPPRRGGRKTPPENETSRQRFLRIGQARVVNALHAIRLVGNLAGQGYAWTPSDIVLMHNTLTEGLEQAFSRFAKSSQAPKLEETFDLKTYASTGETTD